MLDMQIRGVEGLAALSGKFETAVEHALDECAKVMFKAKEQQLGKTYDNKIPTRAQYAKGRKKGQIKARTGKKRVMGKELDSVGNGAKANEPAWVRSGDWLNGQDKQSSPGERRIVDTGNAAKPITNYPGGYAEKMATLPTGPDGVNRRNAAAENATRIENGTGQLQTKFESELKNKLRDMS